MSEYDSITLPRRPQFRLGRPCGVMSRENRTGVQPRHRLPTTGLHPVDVERLVVQLNGLVDAGKTVVVVEHDMSVAAQSDWVIEVGPGAGEEGGRVVRTSRGFA